MDKGSTPGTKMAMVFMKSIAIRRKVCGLCYEVGLVPIGA